MYNLEHLQIYKRSRLYGSMFSTLQERQEASSRYVTFLIKFN